MPDNFDPFANPTTTEENAMPTTTAPTAAHTSPDARLITGTGYDAPAMFWEAANRAMLFPAPRVVQARYTSNPATPDSFEVESIDTTAETVTGHWLCRDSGEWQFGTPSVIGRASLIGEHWHVVDPDQPTPNPIQVGSSVRFTPGRVDYSGRQEGGLYPRIEFGVVSNIVERTPSGHHYTIDVVLTGGDVAQVSRTVSPESESTVELATPPTGAPADAPAPVVTPEREPVIPRDSAAAATMLTAARLFISDETAAALETLVRFLPGGSAEQEGAELAGYGGADLCDQYDRIVVPTLGWAAREHCLDSVRRSLDVFPADMRAYELGHSTLSAEELIQGWTERYSRGGYVNRALVEHMADHLESHKIPKANVLLEAMGMDPADYEVEHDYRVYVTVTREVTVTQQVCVTVTAEDEDAAEELARDTYRLAEAVDEYDWEIRDTPYTTAHGIDDVEVDQVELDD